MIAQERDMNPEAIGYQFDHDFEVKDPSSNFNSPN
jgi:hypothetical protein